MARNLLRVRAIMRTDGRLIGIVIKASLRSSFAPSRFVMRRNETA